MPDLIFASTPNQEAIDFIALKPALPRDVDDQLLPELKPLEFTVAGGRTADAVQDVRELVAELPADASNHAAPGTSALQTEFPVAHNPTDSCAGAPLVGPTPSRFRL